MKSSFLYIYLLQFLICTFFLNTDLYGQHKSTTLQLKNDTTNVRISSALFDTSSSHPNSSPTPSPISLGLRVGSHESQLSTNLNLDLHSDFLIEISISGKIHSEINWLLAFNYWKANTGKKISHEIQITPEEIRSKELKLAINFLIIKFFDNSLLFEQSFSAGNNSKASNSVFSFGESLKVKVPLYKNRIDLVLSGNYQNSSELLNLGGGVGYSMLSYLIGIEINI